MRFGHYAAALIAVTIPHLTSAADAPIARTAAGQVSGLSTDQGVEYLGVPYARPPLGELRWRATQRSEQWDGIRKATSLPPACPQKFGADQRVKLEQSEDCLYVNIYAPNTATAKGQLPVAVWLHGGGNTAGSGSNHDGSRMAKLNDIVVVTVNHRLGALGFLNHPAFRSETKDGLSGNYGIDDTKTALSWVKENIAAFGGDPEKVTVFGESSGASNICAMAVPSSGAAGLYRAQIIESDDCFHDIETAKGSEEKAVGWAEKMGCGAAADVAACLRAKPVEDFVAAGGRWFPHVDSKGLLNKFGIDAIATGDFLKMPTLLGSNRNEGRNAPAGYFKFTQTEYSKWLDQIAGKDNAKRVIKQYAADRYADKPYPIAEIISDVITDSGMRGLGGCTVRDAAIKLSRHVPTYYYQFDDPNAPTVNPIDGWHFGAAHGFEVPYLFPRRDGVDEPSAKFDSGQRQLSDEMIRYWGAFVREGEPAADGLPKWPSFKEGNQVMVLRPSGKSGLVSSEDVSKDHNCDFWTSMPWIMERG